MIYSSDREARSSAATGTAVTPTDAVQSEARQLNRSYMELTAFFSSIKCCHGILLIGLVGQNKGMLGKDMLSVVVGFCVCEEKMERWKVDVRFD